MLKYSLAALFLLVAVVALGCTAWLNFSQLWAEVMVGLVWLSISLALVVGLAGRGPSRTFALGFVAVGAAYFLLAFTIDQRNERLITERAVNWAYGKQQASKAKTTAADSGLVDEKIAWVIRNGANNSQGMSVNYDTLKLKGLILSNAIASEAPRELQDIGHCLWTLLFGLLGGVLAQVVHKRSCRGSTVA